MKEIVMERNISINDALRGIMNEACGIENDEELIIAWQTDEEGGINEFVMYVDDERVFMDRTRISGTIKDEWNWHSNLEPRVKEVEITRKHMCLKEECKKDVDAILEMLKDEIGIDISGILIEWDTDESGKLVRVMVYVDDEAVAGSIADCINDRCAELV